jgi:hypothetical protein
VLSVEARAAAPLPVADGHVQLSYPTDAGPLSYQGDRPFLGANPFVPTNLDGAPNIGLFNSRAVFAWRNRVADFHPHVIAADETVISHAFFKINPQNQQNNGGEFFPGIMEDGHITIQANMQFDQPVFVEENTFLMHVLWDIDQTEQLDHPYHHEHNCHSMTDPFRDFADFFSPAAAFADHPEPNYTLGTVNPVIAGEGTDTLSVNFTFPYHMLMHLSEMGHMPPPAGLPAPHGFLEPFHIHFEYVVKSVPEPSILAILTLGGMAIARRRR